ncbi:hypothetical protein MJI95_38840, partial [Salmonella enterica subsp. enterica serovar Kentucky]|nr:hypothetical protein [Salmonella enterica subsp. enterica serovar Kentucky]
MTLIQGVVNTFVIFISRIIAQIAAGFLGGNRDEGEGSNGNPLKWSASAVMASGESLSRMICLRSVCGGTEMATSSAIGVVGVQW